MTDSHPRSRTLGRSGPHAAKTAVPFEVLVNFGRNSKEKGGSLPRNAISYKHLVIYEQSSYTFIYPLLWSTMDYADMWRTRTVIAGLLRNFAGSSNQIHKLISIFGYLKYKIYKTSSFHRKLLSISYRRGIYVKTYFLNCLFFQVRNLDCIKQIKWN